ncbi:hypothetical protein CWB73_15390 [Pseudoalteromonas phenolica]|uniref:Cadherin domain-containing protein n=1 Tax=Pseudoalteromonas phenolica TaxID=161398 RepID=A0A5S3YRK9_9GAMM|nr:Ig-like domain-containing protein [Pseudoalteromonas phenolica]TMP78901.1 hypothetical protein CWB73_15390 [Pseudoalteromonas phenolica]
MNKLNKVLAACLFCSLVGCGGGETEKAGNEQTIQDIKNDIGVETNSNQNFVSFDYFRKVSGKKVEPSYVVNSAFMNAAANIENLSDNELVKGNITIVINDVEDPEGIQKVLVGFSGSDVAKILCENNCDTNTEIFETGLNPFNFGQSPGTLQLQIWVQDGAGNLSLAKSKVINWLPNTISVSEILREGETLNLTWREQANSIRYNAYLSDNTINSLDNFSLTSNNKRSLSLSESNHTFSDLEPKKNYYALITGIDGSGESAFSEQVFISASEIILPIAVDDSFELEQFSTLQGSLLDNDLDNGLGPLLINIEPIIAPEHGVLTIFANGEFTYTPNGNFYGLDTFRYQIKNPQGAIDEANVSIKIKKINSDPIALFNEFYVLQNSSLTLVGNELILNDIDFDGDSLTIDTLPVEDVKNGTLNLQSSGSFVYTPNEGFIGEDSFIYRLDDGNGGSSTAEVLLVVSPESRTQTLISVNDEYVLNEDDILAVAEPGILANDILPEQTSIGILISKVAENGTVELSELGEMEYMPAENFYGKDYFIYQLEDLSGHKSAAFVTLIVNALNDAPLAQNDSVIVSQGESVTISVLDNDLDVDSEINKSTLTIIDFPMHGNVELNSQSNSFVYTSNADFRGEDYFTYQVSDREGKESNIATVMITVNGENKSPSAVDDSANTQQEQSISINVFENDFDTDGAIDLSSIEITTPPKNGQATTSVSQSSIVYTPNEGFFGSDTFSYSFKDNEGASSNVANVTVSVSRVNKAPIANNDIYSVEYNSSITMIVTENDVDEDGSIDAKSIAIEVSPELGSLVITEAGELIYTNTSDKSAIDTFIYTVRDNEDATSNSATVTINLIAPDTSPIATNDNLVTFKNQPASLNVLNNDDFKGVGIAETPVVLVTQAESGEVEFINQQGDIQYTPNFNFVGTDSITYTAVNLLGETSDPATITFSINDKNYPPTIEPSEVDITSDVVTGQLLTTLIASDPDGDSIGYELLGEFSSLFSVNGQGEVIISDQQTIIDNGNAQYVIDTKVCDNKTPSLCGQSTLTVNVEEVLPTERVVLNLDYADQGTAHINLRASLEYHEVGKAINLADGSTLIASGVGHYDKSQGRNIHRAVVTKITSKGEIDNTFSTEGVFDSNLGIIVDGYSQNIVAQNITFDETNKLIYVSGYLDTGISQHLIIFRLTEQGQLDLTFANDGHYIIPSENAEKASSIELKLIDESLVILTNNDNNGLIHGRLVKYEINTSSVSHSINILAESGSESSGLTLLPDNKAMVFGNTTNEIGNKDIFVRKINLSDFSDDTSFQSSGYLQIDIGEQLVDNRVKALSLLSDNTLLMTGNHQTVVGGGSQLDEYNVFMLKLDINGNLDTSFNNTGFKVYDDSELPTHSAGVDLLSLDADGIDIKEINSSIYLTINRALFNSNYAVQVMKLDLDGNVDISWSPPNGGISIYDNEGLRAHGVLLTSSDLTLYGHNHGDVGYNYFASHWFAKVKVLGELDINYGYLGQATINSTSSDEFVVSTAKQSNGNLLLAGHAANWQNELVPFIHSLNDSGETDKSFGTLGLSRLNFYSSSETKSIRVNNDDSVYWTGNEGITSAFISKLTNFGVADNFYAEGSEQAYFYSSNFSADSIKLTKIQQLENQVQIALAEIGDGCITKSMGLYLSHTGSLVSEFIFEPPVGYECAAEAFKLETMSVDELGFFGFGQDSQTYSVPSIVVVNSDNTGTLNPSFGDSGVAVFDVGALPGEQVFVKGYILAPDNDFLIYGLSGNENFIIKMNSFGGLDTTFAENGVYKFSSYFEEAVVINSILIDSKNRLVVISKSNVEGGIYFSKLQLLENPGSLDLQFANVGYQLLQLGVEGELVDVQYHFNNESFLLTLQNNISKRITVSAVEIVEETQE